MAKVHKTNAALQISHESGKLEKAERGNHETELSISDVTYVVTVSRSEHAQGTLGEKLKKLILETACNQATDLSEE